MEERSKVSEKNDPNRFSSRGAGIYELRVADRLDILASGWFEGMTVCFDEGVTPTQTIIRALIEDQAALYGLISRARDLGLMLVSVNRIELKTETNSAKEQAYP